MPSGHAAIALLLAGLALLAVVAFAAPRHSTVMYRPVDFILRH